MTLLETLKRNRLKLAVVFLLLVIGGLYAYAHRAELNREALVEYGQDLPPVVFIIAFLILPVFGFPISLLLVLAGIRFGTLVGMAITAPCIFFHHFAAYRITHGLFRERLRTWLANAGYAIPPINAKHRAWFTALFAAIHGPPYAPKLYLLALTDIPFRYYFWIGAPVYIAFAILPVVAGSAVMDMNLGWISAIVVAMIGLGFLGHWLKRRYAGADDGT